MSDLMFGVLRANGFKVTATRKDGSRTARTTAVALTSGVEVTFVLEAPAVGDWTLTGTRGDTGQTFTRSNTPAEIASDAVAYAHRVNSS